MPGAKMIVLARPFQSAVRALVASAMVLVSPLALMARNTSTSLTGVYVARVAKTAPSMTVSLGADGTATVTGDLGKGSITSFGHWEGNGSQVKVTFNAEEGAPSDTPMVFAATPTQLQVVNWNKEAWGDATPPVMKKGYKVKYLFWSTTMR